MKNSEIDELDEEVAEKFRESSRFAYESAIEAGIPVTILQDGSIYQVQKLNGSITRTKVKDLRPVQTME